MKVEIEDVIEIIESMDEKINLIMDKLEISYGDDMNDEDLEQVEKEEDTTNSKKSKPKPNSPNKKELESLEEDDIETEDDTDM